MFHFGALGLGFDGDFFLVDGDLDTLGFPLALGRFVATFFDDDFSNRNQYNTIRKKKKCSTSYHFTPRKWWW